MADPIWALGTMSGTSLDGVDAALVLSDGEKLYEFGESRYEAYTEREREFVFSAMGGWPGDLGVGRASRIVEDAHIRVLRKFRGGDVIGFHGQTLTHDPANRKTHQCGDGAKLADATGVPVVWDFRTADVELGGQGAPLAPFFHFALSRYIGSVAPVAFLNLGGIGNLTWVDPSAPNPQSEGALLAFDTGPANAPINDLMARSGAGPYDENGALALSGQPDPDIVDAAMGAGFFNRFPPKSLDRGDFGTLLEQVGHLAIEDSIASLVEICARAVARGFEFMPKAPTRLLVGGGGRHNKAIMDALTRLCPCPVAPVETVGLDGDMLEAQAFAHLAVRVMRGLPTSAPGTTGVMAAVGGGRISEPRP